jgi:hypothetical protein
MGDIWNALALSMHQVKQFRVRRATPLREFREQLAAEMGVPLEKQRLWTFAKRQNNTLRWGARILHCMHACLLRKDLQPSAVLAASLSCPWARCSYMFAVTQQEAALEDIGRCGRREVLLSMHRKSFCSLGC